MNSTYLLVGEASSITCVSVNLLKSYLMKNVYNCCIASSSFKISYIGLKYFLSLACVSLILITCHLLSL